MRPTIETELAKIEAEQAVRRSAHQEAQAQNSGVRYGSGVEPWHELSDAEKLAQAKRRVDGWYSEDAALKRRLFAAACGGSIEADAVYAAASRGDAGWQERARKALGDRVAA